MFLLCTRFYSRFQLHLLPPSAYFSTLQPDTIRRKRNASVNTIEVPYGTVVPEARDEPTTKRSVTERVAHAR